MSKKVVTKSDTGWETSVRLHPETKAGKHQVQVTVHSHHGNSVVFLTRKQAESHFKRALHLVQRDTPFKLVGIRPDIGFCTAYKVLDKGGRLVGVIQREVDNSKTWWVQIGDNEHSEGISYGARWAALQFLQTKASH